MPETNYISTVYTADGSAYDIKAKALSTPIDSDSPKVYSDTGLVFGTDYTSGQTTYSASAGMRAFCWSAATSSGLIWTFDITDAEGETAHPMVTVPSGKYVSVKADYSWSFAGTLKTEIDETSTQVQVELFNTPPSNWTPTKTEDPVVIGNPEEGYLWFPEYPEAGVIPKGISTTNLGRGNKVNEEGAAALGRQNIADGRYSLVLGRENYGGYNSLVSGYKNKCFGVQNTCTGYLNEVNGSNNAVCGRRNTANGNDNFICGQSNVANGNQGIIGGLQNQLNYTNQAAFGVGLLGSNSLSGQVLLGKWNVQNENPFTIGWGSSSTRKNIAIIDANGNLHLSGKIYINDSPSAGSGGTELVNYTLPAATASSLGGVKLGDSTIQTVAAQGVTLASNRTYAIQINGSGQMVVNIPWTDTDRVPDDWEIDGTDTITTSQVENSYSTLCLNQGYAFLDYYNDNNANTARFKVNDNGPVVTFIKQETVLYNEDIVATVGDPLNYGVCSTSAGTVAKTVTIPGVTRLVAGLTVRVKFSNHNSASNPTLNVNSLGAKAIKRYGSTAPGTGSVSSWQANQVVVLTYDGTYWQLNDWQGGFQVMQQNSTTSLNYRVILSNNDNDDLETASVKKSNGLLFNPSTKELKIDSYRAITIKTSSSAPTTSTTGFVGQILVYNNNAYICVSKVSSSYTWKQITFDSAESQVG